MPTKLFAVLISAIAVPLLAAGIPPNVCPVDPQTKLITYQAVVPVEGVSASELYSRAKLWIAKTYHSAKAVIDLDDKDAGRIVAKGIFTVPYAMSTMNVRHQLTVEVKDGRFRYTLTDLVKLQPDSPIASYREWPLEGGVKEPFFTKKTWENIDKGCLGIVESLTKAMSAPVTTDKW